MSDRLIALPEVMARTGFSKRFIYEHMALGDFPKATAIGSARRWSEAEISAWIDSKKAARDQQEARTA